MRDKLGFPINITSGYRCKPHNEEIGGALHSYHLLFATDIRPNFGRGFQQRLHAMWHIAEEIGFTGIIIYNSWLHLDCRDVVHHGDKRKTT